MKKILLFAAIFESITFTASAQWQTVGNAGFSESSVQFTSLAFNSSNEPFVAYQGYFFHLQLDLRKNYYFEN